jgi:hypothetical protein
MNPKKSVAGAGEFFSFTSLTLVLWLRAYAEQVTELCLLLQQNLQNFA